MVVELIIILDNELVLYESVNRQPFVRLFLQQAFDKTLQLRRYTLDRVEVGWWIRLHSFRLNYWFVRLRVRRLPNHHFIDNHAQSPYVGWERISLALQSLGRHVADGAHVSLCRLELLLRMHALWRQVVQGWRHACAHDHHWIVEICLLESEEVLRINLLLI